jgi:type IX secretion system substrate protein
MKKLTCLLLLVIAACRVCLAQHGPAMPDSPADPQAAKAGELLFEHISAAIKGANEVSLQWDNDSSVTGDYFIVERSQDGQHYETIGALAATGGKDHYELTDQAPPNGLNIYRVRYTSEDGHNLYSKTMSLSLSGDVDFKFYPNPVDKVFIVRTSHPIDLEILDPSGVVRISKRLQPGLQVINATSLEHGVYVLRVTDKESNRAVSSQLVKN